MKRPRIRFLLPLLLCCAVVAGLSTFAWKRSVWVAPNQSGDRHIVAPQTQSLVLFALGDTGTGDEMQYKTAAAMEARCQKLGGISGILLLGDNFYAAGVTSVEDPQWQKKFELPYGGDCLKKVPVYPVLGNHDYKGNTGAQIDYSRVNPRWHMLSRFYTVDFAQTLRVVAFDSGFPDFCFLPEHCSVDYLLREVDAPAFDRRIVIAHNPLSSASQLGYGHSGGLFGTLMRPLLCKKVDAYVSGHAHHLEHRQVPGCAADLYVSGAGGAELYPIQNGQPATKFAANTYGFLEFTVTQETLQSRFISQEGAELYQYSRTHP